MKLFNHREPLQVVGARIEFKGSVPWEVLQSTGVQRILQAAACEAPETVGNVITVTSTHRVATTTSRFSYHLLGEAVDIRTGVFEAAHTARGAVVRATEADRRAISDAWAERIRQRLGGEFDVVYGDGKHIDHIHIERDGAKSGHVYLER